MNTAAQHHIDCPWHLDQYPHECTCGAGQNLDTSGPSAEDLSTSQVRDDPRDERKQLEAGVRDILATVSLTPLQRCIAIEKLLDGEPPAWV